MGITLASNFDVNAALPLDSRMVVADLTARDAIVAGRRFQGMCVYVLADTLTYQLKTGILNTDWVEYGGAGAAITYVETFSGDGGTLTFTLAADPVAVENTQVYIHGVYQQKNVDYVLNTPDIDFVVAPPVGTDNIEVVYATPTTPLVIPDGYIDTVKLADDAVTNAKILSMDAAKLIGSIPAGTIPDGSITDAKLVDSIIGIDKLTGAILSSSAAFTGSTIGTSFVDVGSSSLSFTKGTTSASKMLRIEVVPNTLTSVSYITGTDYEVQLLMGATVVGIHRYSGSGVTEHPVTILSWLHNSGLSATQTYKLQFRTLTGATAVSFTNAKLSIGYA